MKILSAEQVYQTDRFTIENQGIGSDELMERAAIGIFNWIHSRLQGGEVKIHVFCGIGNNGGDGLALARHLKQHGYDIGVYIANYSDKRSEDFLKNLARLKDNDVWPAFMSEGDEFPAIGPSDMVIDAIFGIGLNREAPEWVNNLIAHINAAQAFTLAVDVPSGMRLDQSPKEGAQIVSSQCVLSFQCPKLPFFLPETAPFVDYWEPLDIGLDYGFIQSLDTPYEYLLKPDVQPIYRNRPRVSHKGDYGHVLMIGGSYGKIGAIKLSSEACLRTGAGLVTALVPKCGYQVLQGSLAEAMVITDGNEEFLTKISVPEAIDVCCIGMGMGQEKESVAAMKSFLASYQGDLVVDADAINILGSNKRMLSKLPEHTILTPHPGELKRLVGEWKDDHDKLEKVRAFCEKYSVIVVIKGAFTIVQTASVGYVNSTGNPGMATAGSGDVLAGMIAALIAQGYDPLHAAVFGVYLHGSAGDIYSSQYGPDALIASDIIDHIGPAFMNLFKPAQVQAEQAAAEGQEQ